MHNLKFVIIFVVVVFAGFFTGGRDASALAVKTLRFGRHDAGTRIVMDLDSEADFRATVQTDPPRIVIDLPALTDQPQVKRSQLPDIVRDIRIEAVSGGLSRLSFILNNTATIRSAFLIPSSGNGGARLVVDAAPASQPVFDQQVGRPYGTLQIAGDGTVNAPGSLKTLPFAGIAKPQLAPISQPNSPTIGGPTIDTPKVDSPNKLPLVMIDAGHGGIDPGASGSGVREKDVTLAVAKNLRDALRATGKYRAELTRDHDIFIPLAERVQIARRAGADLFVSIHADSMPGASSATGASFYTLSDQASDAQTARLAARENQADLLAGVQLPTKDKDVATILIDLAMRETTNQSKRFANYLVGAFKDDALPTAPSPDRHAGFMVLKAPDVPSVLVELGFLSNPAESKKLNDPAYRKTLGNTIADGVDRWFKTRKNP